MGSVTWGSGIDTFGLNFLDAAVSDSGTSEWQTADAQNHVHVAFQCKEMKSYYEEGIDTNPYHTTPNDICFNYINDGGQWKVQYNSNENKPDGFFTRSCLLYNDGNGYHVVSDVTDIQRMIWEPNVMVNTSSRSQIDGTTLSYTTYQINTTYNQGTVSIEKKNDSTVLISGLTIFPWLLAPDYLTHLMNHYSAYNEEELNEWGNNVKRENATYGSGTGNCKRYRPHFALDITQLFPSGNYQSFVIKSSDGNFVCELDYNTNNFPAITGRYYIASEHMLLLWIASCGLKFKWNNKIYKPIAENGVIVGYTDDMDKESEWDNWHDFNDHVVPDVPPTPTPSGGGDDYDDMSLGVSNVTLGGLTKYAILTKQELIDLVIDYNTNGSAAGTNFSNHVICLYRLGFGASDLVVTSSDKIKMIQSAGNVDFESSANYSIVSRQTPFIHFGSIKVPRHTGTFYDFSPYSSYELYIPGCGWIPLPDNVAGRNLNVYLVFDLPTCSAKGIVRIEGGVYGGTTIATVNGIIGASVPFTIGENGMQRAAVMSANAQVAAGIATGIVGATINPMMAVAGGAELLSGLIGAYTAGNTNYVSTKGGAADFSVFGDGAAAMLKYNAPEIDPVVNNPDFGHTVGYMCNETGQLSNFHGFTVCSNPHIHISATSTEKEEIKKLLEEGVILP